MYVYGVYFLLNLCNFTKYCRHVTIIPNIILCVSILCFGYKYLIHSFFTPQITFKIFLYKFLFFLSNINTNLFVFVLIIVITNIYITGFNKNRWWLVYFMFVEVNFYEQYNLISFFNKSVNTNLINGLFLIHPIYLLMLFTLTYVCIVHKKNTYFYKRIINNKLAGWVKWLVLGDFRHK